MQWAQKQKGFTIVELLIVVVVIAILAAVTIVGYNGIQNRAHNSAVLADLNNAAKKLELFRVENGRYPSVVAEMPADFSLSKQAYDLTTNNVYYCNDNENHVFALGFRSKSMRGYILTSSSGLSEGVTVNGGQTCDAIGKNWAAPDATTAVIQGYWSATGWSSLWSWTR